MKKSVSLAALLLVLAAPTVFAQDMIGIGWDNGYSIRIPIDPITVQITGRFDSVIPEDDDADTQTDVEIAAYLGYPILDANSSELNVFGGVGILPSTRDISVGSRTYDKELGFLLRFGIEPVVMVTDNIGISGKAALEINVDPGYDGLDDSGTTEVGAWGSVGVHWYF